MAEVILSITETVSELIEIEGETVEISGDEVSVVEVGIQGPPGASGEVSAPISFGWGDATPAFLTTISAGKRVYVTELVIATAFNGAGAALTIGPLAAPSELMTASENNPADVASYEANPDKLYASTTAIYLHITPGAGASAGSGQVRLQIEP